jgi:hypothetical protein
MVFTTFKMLFSTFSLMLPDRDLKL